MAVDLTFHIAIWKLIIGYSMVGIIVMTAIVTLFSTIGIIKLPDDNQQKYLFKLLIGELVLISVGTFSNLISLNPSETQVEVESDFINRINKSSPVITRVEVLPDTSDPAIRAFNLKVYFFDPEGDANYINWMLVKTNGKSLKSTSSTMEIDSEIQKSGAIAQGHWTCDSYNYYMEKAVIIADKEGNISKPFFYTVKCES